MKSKEKDSEEKFSESDSEEDEIESDVCYYSKNEKKYKIFVEGVWQSTDTRPTSDELLSLQKNIKQGPEALEEIQRARAISGQNLLTDEEAEKKELRKLKRKRAQQNKK